MIDLKESTFSGNWSSERISVLKNDLLNRTIKVFMWVVLLFVPLSFTRAFETGLNAAIIVHATLSALFLVMVVFRKRISYSLRFWIIEAILLSVACVGMASYGLLALGWVHIGCAALLAAVFASKKISYSMLGLGVVIILSFMLMFGKGWLKISVDPNEYISAMSSWANLMTTYSMFFGVIVSVITSLFGSLKLAIHESENRLRKIKELNTYLEHKVGERTSELTESNKDKDRILGIVAHDINNKLFGVMGYLEMARGVDPNLPNSTYYGFIEKAREACSLAADIVSDLLDYARNEVDELPLPVEPVNMSPFIKSTVECHLPKALEKGIDLKISNAPKYAFAIINRSKMSRVIDNLVNNALKFTSKGGAVDVKIMNHEDELLITISDTGVGIPDKLKPNIFDAFSDSGRPGTLKEKSNGLGLSITKNIVEQHEGRIWFESQEGKGSSFFLRLPAQKTEAEKRQSL